MHIKTFLRAESGAVTVDWVVMTSAVVGLGLATMAVVSGGVENLSTSTAQALADTAPDGGDIWSWGAGAAVASAWGELGMLHFADQAAAEARVAEVLESSFGGDHQAYYDAAYAFASQGTEIEIDAIGALEASAAAAGVELETGENMSYRELHAANEAGTLG